MYSECEGKVPIKPLAGRLEERPRDQAARGESELSRDVGVPHCQIDVRRDLVEDEGDFEGDVPGGCVGYCEEGSGQLAHCSSRSPLFSGGERSAVWATALLDSPHDYQVCVWHTSGRPFDVRARSP